MSVQGLDQFSIYVFNGRSSEMELKSEVLVIQKWYAVLTLHAVLLKTGFVVMNKLTDIHRGLSGVTRRPPISYMNVHGQQILSLDLIMYSSIIKALFHISPACSHLPQQLIFHPHLLPFLSFFQSYDDSGVN